MCAKFNYAFIHATMRSLHNNLIIIHVGRTFSELVRCPQHPEREGEYIMELCPDKLKLWHPQKQTIAFEWKLQSVRRAQYHNRSGKVEVEVGRYNDLRTLYIYIGCTIFSKYKHHTEVSLCTINIVCFYFKVDKLVRIAFTVDVYHTDLLHYLIMSTVVFH